jgi:hypothetical protein
MVHDVWDEVELPFDPAMPLTEVKRRALELARVTDPAGRFLLKYHGAELRDEERTLEAAGIPPAAPLIVLRRHRRAVR